MSGIQTLLFFIEKMKNIDSQIIIVENNGKRPTFLDQFINKNQNIHIFYTNNNFINTKNKGYKELMDVLDAIAFFNVQNDDFIVKITGRYIFQKDTEFFNKLVAENNYDCILRYGPYYAPDENKINDCITGLIGLKCKYIKNINLPNENECVEWKWALATHEIQHEKKCIMTKLGIHIFPLGENYIV
jgi:hypothetical protein